MDRPSTSTNPLFMEQDDDMNSFVTKSHLFGAQRALHQEQQAMSERIDNLATDLGLSEQRTRDYFDHKLDDHKQENDARMDEICALFLNHSSSTSSSSRRSRSSRHSDFTLSGSSTPTSNTLRRAARNDRQASLNPLHDNDSQEQARAEITSTPSKSSYIRTSTRTATPTTTRTRGTSATTSRCTRRRGTTSRTTTT